MLGNKKITLGLLQILCLVAAVKILLYLKKNKFIPRLSIIGCRNTGKTRLFYALRDHRIVSTVHSLTTNIFSGMLSIVNHEVEIIDFSSDQSKWPKDWRRLIRNSLCILLVVKDDQYEEAFEIVTKFSWVIAGITIVVKKNEETIQKLRSYLKDQNFSQKFIDRVDAIKVVEANLDELDWNIQNLVPVLQAVL